ncbi:MAG: hypothetical protein PHI85_07490 [Victivallaceae bacterium]|nr:hypothetical protein [Victivallaceae bacterium]
MAAKNEKQKLKLPVGTIYQKEIHGTFYFRYQLNGHRKAVSLKTNDLDAAEREAKGSFLL